MEEAAPRHIPPQRLKNCERTRLLFMFSLLDSEPRLCWAGLGLGHSHISYPFSYLRKKKKKQSVYKLRTHL